jgi:glucitol operon activator protein
MQYTQHAMALLALFWALQVAGSWVQWTHYRKALRQATARWGDGYLGMGKARSRIGFGVLALLEVDPRLNVRSLQVMTGATVFARFRTMALTPQTTIDQLATRYAAGVDDSRLARAVRQAIQQIEEVRSRQA